jgi:poly(hydroxyalkanoate) depolymerase family esterase
MAYKLFVPEGAASDAPLLVMLHGCTQDPDDFARGTGMNAAAAAWGFVVAYPRQEASRNPNRCWSWFEPSQTGEAGEAAMIAAIARREARDPGRVFAAGLSAGGAMAAALGAAHGHVFRAVGIHSGLAAGAANDMTGAFAAMAGRGGQARPLPVPAIVFHGAADRTVAPINAERIATAGRTGGGKPKVLRGETGGRAWTRARLPALGAVGAVETWRVEGLGHAWSGGSRAGSHADPAGPDASAEMLRFFRASR